MKYKTKIRETVQLGELLVRAGIITEEHLEIALGKQTRAGHKDQLGFYLKEMGVCTEQDIQWILSLQHKVLNGGLDLEDFANQAFSTEEEQEQLDDIVKLSRSL